MISSKKIQQGQSETISRTLEIKKILDKPPKDRMPFQTIEICHFLSKIYLFKILFPNQSENFMQVAMGASLSQFTADTYIYNQADRVQSLYLIIKGNISLNLNNFQLTLGRCSTFGQLEILFGLQERLCNVKTTSEVWCILISKDLLLSSCQRKYKITQIYNFLDRNPYFSDLSRLQKLFLSTKSQKIKYNEGTYLLNIGQIPDKILCVLGGTVSVLKSVTKQDKTDTFEIDLLEQGSVIGQYESINQVKSEISLYCRTGGKTFLIPVSCFFINMLDIKNNAPYLIDFFKKNQMLYPDSRQIEQLFIQQKKQERFKQKQKKYLLPRKERLR